MLLTRGTSVMNTFFQIKKSHRGKQRPLYSENLQNDQGFSTNCKMNKEKKIQAQRMIPYGLFSQQAIYFKTLLSR